jgi:hypothetical protein
MEVLGKFDIEAMLVAILNGTPSVASNVREWNWIKATVLHHFP